MAQQTNFAIWYSFYRTRLALTKSAASFAFAPINDTRRVGFITVEPKDTPTSAAINPIRYLPVGDFNATQKGKWFAKVFSQEAKGASPAREGLARVGRYYGGQDDGINNGMPATGVNDPIQYACQQNFTIMTTDGYWNGHTETPGGGGVMLDGVTKVGQQDGILPRARHLPQTDPYCKRPMWDGGFDTVHIVTDKTNAYTDNVCSIDGRYRSTFQNQQQTSLTTRDSSRTQADDPVPAGDAPGRRGDDADHQDRDPDGADDDPVRAADGALRRGALPARQVAGADDQVTRAVRAADDADGAVVPDAARSPARSSWTRTSTRRRPRNTWSTTTQYVRQIDQYVLSRTQKIGRQFLTIAYNGATSRAPRSTAIAFRAPATGRSNAPSRSSPARPLVDPATCVRSRPTVGGEPGTSRRPAPTGR